MATYVKGANGAFSGKVGSVVGSSWRSINYLRSLPKTIKRNASEAQAAHRAKFALAGQFLRPIKDVLNLGYSDHAQTKLSGYNLAIRDFFFRAIEGVYPDYTIDFSKVEVSRGTLGILNNLVYSESGPGMLTFTWSTKLNKMNAYSNDQVLLVLLNETKDQFVLYDEALRPEGTYQVEVSIEDSGDVMHAWGFALSQDAKRASKSQYLGELTIS